MQRDLVKIKSRLVALKKVVMERSVYIPMLEPNQQMWESGIPNYTMHVVEVMIIKFLERCQFWLATSCWLHSYNYFAMYYCLKEDKRKTFFPNIAYCYTTKNKIFYTEHVLPEYCKTSQNKNESPVLPKSENNSSWHSIAC